MRSFIGFLFMVAVAVAVFGAVLSVANVFVAGIMGVALLLWLVDLFGPYEED